MVSISWLAVNLPRAVLLLHCYSIFCPGIFCFASHISLLVVSHDGGFVLFV